LSLSESLDEYQKDVATWVDAARKSLAAVQRLQKTAASGNVRDLEKTRQAAITAARAADDQADKSTSFEFDLRSYLEPQGEFIQELEDAARDAGVRLYKREGVIYCYPVLVRIEPDLSAVRIDKKLDPNIRPEVLTLTLKRLQSKEPKSRPDQFIETLFNAYEYVRARSRHTDYIAERLVDIYRVLTLRPGSKTDYSELEFARDIYFLDVSDVEATRSGATKSFTASTASKEQVGRIYKFVGRDGTEKDYASIKFSLPDRGV